MREIDLTIVSKKVEEALIEACEIIPSSVSKCLQKSLEEETSPLGRIVLEQIIENNEIARNQHLPICQDTGIVVCFLEIGQNVSFSGNIYEAINQGVREAYQKGYLRKSVVKHPLDRINTNDNTPAIIHTKIIPGDQIIIKLAPKGAGSENMSLVKMLTPADGEEGIKKLVIETVVKAGGKPCPPIIVGIGIGGDLEKAALLAKEALFREIGKQNEELILQRLENDLLHQLNQLAIGPMGFGGSTTCLAVNINAYPCHIASLPVAINIQCHASRHRTIII